MIVVVDTGIWLSAVRFGGIPQQALIRAATIDRIAISDTIVAEIIRNMEQKFGVPGFTARRIVRAYTAEGVHVTVSHELKGVCRDPNDNHVLECAMKAEADLIVTGDKDLLAIALFQGTSIVTARQYVEQK